jgi:hypothetical protein
MAPTYPKEHEGSPLAEQPSRRKGNKQCPPQIPRSGMYWVQKAQVFLEIDTVNFPSKRAVLSIYKSSHCPKP